MFSFIGEKLSVNSPPILNQEKVNPLGKTSGVTILEINGERYEQEIDGPISVYEFMKKIKENGRLEFTEKNYVGIGKFVDSINGVSGNNKKSWIYYVNDKKANVGVSVYEINKGDVVSWNYESQY